MSLRLLDTSIHNVNSNLSRFRPWTNSLTSSWTDKFRWLYPKDETAEGRGDEMLSVPEKFLCKRQTYEAHALAKSPFYRELPFA